MSKQHEKAELFRSLHRGSEILVLPNAWDCASASIYEAEGFPAIATTSAGVAYAMGYPDGQRIQREDVRRIAATVDVPVTADLEAGYDDAAATAADLVDAGAIGLNIEDTIGDTLAGIDVHVRRIDAVRRTGEALGVPIVINARTDVYMLQEGDPATRFESACERLKAYIQAGADCVFLPGVREEELIRRFVEALHFPINILAVAGAPSIPRMKQLGVARVSVGSGIARAAMGLTRRIAREIRTSSSYESMLQEAIPYAEANRLFSKG